MSQLNKVAGAHTAVTVNDKSNPTSATAGEGTYGAYAGGETDNLHIAAMKGTDGKLTYNIKLNDQLSIGKKDAAGTNGTDGKIGVNGRDGSAVVINGKDGSIGLNGKNGANGLTIKGDKGAVGVDGTDGKDGKDGMTRIVYQDANQSDHTVAS